MYRIHALIWPARNPIYTQTHTRRPHASAACRGQDRIADSGPGRGVAAQIREMRGCRSLGVTVIDSGNENNVSLELINQSEKLLQINHEALNFFNASLHFYHRV